MVNFGEVRSVQLSQVQSPHLDVGAPGIFSNLLSFVQTLKRQWGEESNGKLARLFIPTKTVTLVPEFAEKNLPLGRKLMMIMISKKGSIRKLKKVS